MNIQRVKWPLVLNSWISFMISETSSLILTGSLLAFGDLNCFPLSIRTKSRMSLSQIGKDPPLPDPKEG